MKVRLAALEAGGTKCIAAVGTPEDGVEREVRIPTGEPEATLKAILDFFDGCRRDGLGFAALGIGSFGPLDPEPHSPTWGRILETPKAGWSGFKLGGRLLQDLQVPVGFDTDVNAAALAEAQLGAGRGWDPVVYYTVGTGIGAGVVLNGEILHGALHPEMGHMSVRRHPEDSFAGVCSFHKDCWEGLASGPALAARWGASGESLPPEHPAWDLEAYYLAQGLVNTVLVLSPQKILLGGGLGAVPGLLSRVRDQAARLSAGYLGERLTRSAWDRLLTAPSLVNPGLTGGFLLARQALREAWTPT